MFRRAMFLGMALVAAPALAQTSLNVTLLGHQQLQSSYSACWGYTGPGGQELALIGASTGTSIVDVTTPTAPVQRAFIAGVTSVWREMKTYSHYAYITTEGTNGGLQIVDLATNPPSLVKTYRVNFNTAHTITIAGGYAFVNGTRQNGTFTGVRILSLADPVNPVEVGAYLDYYVHDCAVRGNTLYAACINNGLIAVVDIANRAVPATVTTFAWVSSSAHNCDLTTDGLYLFTTDEQIGGDLRVWDISSVGDIHQVAEWSANSDASIHNVHVLGNLAYISYYTEGLRVVDISNPLYPVQVGYYDTWPGASGGYNGNWEVYPYAASGNAYLSDISTGLYVVRFQQGTGSVNGTVTEAGSGAPLAGASVRSSPSVVAQAISTGYYKLFDAPGPYTLVTSLYGFRSDSSGVTLAAATNVTRDVQLVRLPYSGVFGQVRNATNDSPLAGASLVVSGTPLASQTSAGGLYSFPHIPYGVYMLSASLFGYTPQSRAVVVATRADSLRFDLELQPAALATDFEAGPAGWSVQAPPDSASTGKWIWSDPVGSGGGGVQPEDDHTLGAGHLCWVTGNALDPSSPIGDADVDGGRTFLLTSIFDLTPLANPSLSYWRWYSNAAGSNPGQDTLIVDISNNGGATWTKLERVVQTPSGPGKVQSSTSPGSGVVDAAGGTHWVQVTLHVADKLAPTSQMRLRFIAEDLGGGSIVEAAIDDFMAFETQPTAVLRPPDANRLFANVPNPFNPTTRLRFDLARPGVAALRIFDARGRFVRQLASGWLAAGTHERLWDGRDERGHALASGVYLYRLESAGFRASRSMLLLK